MKFYPVDLFGSTYMVRPEIASYKNNGTLAIELIDDEDDPFAVLTVNLQGQSDLLLGEKDLAYVDTNNCPFADEFLKKSGLGTPVGVYGQSGYCSYPLYRFDIERIRSEQIETEKHNQDYEF